MNRDADRFEALLAQLVTGECNLVERDELAQLCATEKGRCQRVMEALSFSEFLHQACVSEDKAIFEQNVLENLRTNSDRDTLYIERLLAGEALAVEEKGRWIGTLVEQADRLQELRDELEFEELIAQAVSETKSEEAFVQALSTRMWAEVEEDHFVEDLASKIIDLGAAQVSPTNSIVSIALTDQVESAQQQRQSLWWAFLPKPALAAAAAVALAAIIFWDYLPVYEQGHVLAQSGQVSWDTDFGKSPKADGAFAKGLYRLESGVVYLRFQGGAEMSMEGPAVFEIKGKGEVELRSGLVLARGRVDSKKGFKLVARGLDLLTSGSTVGLDLRDEEAPELFVLSGGAEVKLAEGGGNRRLHDFEAIRADLERDKLVDIPFNARPFSKAWQLMSGVAANTGTVEVVVPGSQNRRILGGDRIRVTVERDQFELTENEQLEVDTLSKGRFVSMGANQAGEILAEKGRLRSYLLELKPGDEHGASESTLEASMTFDHPVVGVIFSEGRLVDSDELLGSGDSLNGTVVEGQVLLSDDGRTVNLLLSNVGSKPVSGMVRVLVALN